MYIFTASYFRQIFRRLVDDNEQPVFQFVKSYGQVVGETYSDGEFCISHRSQLALSHDITLFMLALSHDITLFMLALSHDITLFLLALSNDIT